MNAFKWTKIHKTYLKWCSLTRRFHRAFIGPKILIRSQVMVILCQILTEFHLKRPNWSDLPILRKNDIHKPHLWPFTWKFSYVWMFECFWPFSWCLTPKIDQKYHLQHLETCKHWKISKNCIRNFFLIMNH